MSLTRLRRWWRDAHSSHHMWILELDSGDDERRGCKLVVSVPGWYFQIPMPAVVKPHRFWEDTSQYAWSSKDGGYWDYQRREYGITYMEGHVSLRYGIQTDSWPGSACKGFFLPWMEWRFIRRSFCGLDGEYLAHFADPKLGFMAEYNFQQQMPQRHFAFTDYDGEPNVVATTIEEREWHKGTGGFRWLSWFVKPKIRRSLDLAFDKEVGPKKGSWKGGTLGHGIDMLAGELHEDAFRRYCVQENLTFGSVLGDAEVETRRVVKRLRDQRRHQQRQAEDQPKVAP